MADSTVTDVSKMKVVDLRKELKARGLASTGDKAELVVRLQEAMTQDQDDHADINLDSDEIDSDGVLDDDDKSQNDILEDSAVESLSEELALAEQPPPSPEPVVVTKSPIKTLKRKITMSKTKDKEENVENKETSAKKIVLNRAFSIPSLEEKPKDQPNEQKTEVDKPVESNAASESNKVKITADVDAKTRLELRAKRFGLPVKMNDDQRKEARKQRFGQSILSTSSTGTLSENLDKLKKRSERFGQSVSKIMTEIEKKEQLEKRRARFGTVK